MTRDERPVDPEFGTGDIGIDAVALESTIVALSVGTVSIPVGQAPLRNANEALSPRRLLQPFRGVILRSAGLLVNMRALLLQMRQRTFFQGGSAFDRAPRLR